MVGIRMDQIKLKGYIAMKIKEQKKRKIWPLMVTVAFDNESRIVYDYESLIVFILPSLHISYQLCGSMDLFAKLYSALF